MSATSDGEAFEHYDDPANHSPAAGERAVREAEKHLADHRSEQN